MVVVEIAKVAIENVAVVVAIFCEGGGLYGKGVSSSQNNKTQRARPGSISLILYCNIIHPSSRLSCSAVPLRHSNFTFFCILSASVL